MIYDYIYDYICMYVSLCNYFALHDWMPPSLSKFMDSSSIVQVPPPASIASASSRFAWHSAGSKKSHPLGLQKSMTTSSRRKSAEFCPVHPFQNQSCIFYFFENRITRKSGTIHQLYTHVTMYIYMGLSENSVPLHPMVNDHYPY